MIKDQSIGGNAPLLARALATLGAPGTLIGAVGFPSIQTTFLPLNKMGLAVHSFAEPGYTDALEFTDGKLLLGKMGELSTISLREAENRLPVNLLASLVSHAEVIATVNWTMMPLVDEFWGYLLHNPHLLQNMPRKTLFVDLADPAKRPVKDLKKALSCLSKLGQFCDVVVGLNRSESTQVLHALRKKDCLSLQKNAETIASALHLSCVVLHTHPQVATAYVQDNEVISHALDVPICKTPVRSTGAGDTFNAGFIAGILQHLPPYECLKLAIGASGAFVRTGISPTRQHVKQLLHKFSLS